jgi:hypothetical protein
MTFKKFEEIFKTKYPDGEVLGHGCMAQTETTRQTSVIFKPNGKVYDYYGAYEDVLSRLGFKVISKARLRNVEHRLESYRKENGTPKLFVEFGVHDYSKEIAEYEEYLNDIYTNYIIV